MHTPGPWVHAGGAGLGELVVAPGAPKGQRHIAVAYGGPSGNKGEANAKLIAAAPSMADALEAAFAELDNCAGNNDDERKGDEFRNGHRCVNCDENVDRNSEIRDRIRVALRAAGRLP